MDNGSNCYEDGVNKPISFRDAYSTPIYASYAVGVRITLYI